MCGIGGWIGETPTLADPQILLQALRHRGPDGEGYLLDEPHHAGLIHTRLAVIDITDTGSQPMTYDWGTPQVGRYSLIYNGEIYNYEELREGIDPFALNGSSDTEILLHLLTRDGVKVLPRLAGMFAFAFFDHSSGAALLARDPFGIKPLYYSTESGSLKFASEVKALRTIIGSATLSPASVRDTLMWGSVPEPATLWNGIHELPAGCYLEWKAGSATVKRWHQLAFGNGEAPSNPVAHTRDALLESVGRHLVSDVPVGFFLSGGVDSTAVLALARTVLGPNVDIRTFSIGFDDPALDESRTARRTAKHFGSTHTEWMMTEEEGIAEVASYLAAIDQPTVDGFNTWCVSKLAKREGVKVVLSGLGGDEMFGGYGSFNRVPRFLDLFRRLGVFRPAAAAALGRSPAGSRWRRLGQFLLGPGTALSAFHAQRGIFTEPEARELAQSITGTDPGPADWRAFDGTSEPLDQVSMLELTRYMRNQLLRDSDVFSMASGLELRVPFVDARLFESISIIPALSRLRSGKALLVDAVPEIPEWVRGQPKRGFRFPFEDWTRDGFGKLLDVADEVSPVPLREWYRRWALAVVLLEANPKDSAVDVALSRA
ncbi:MAG: asparagine synthase (glutamine-hydrolyzing) [Gemmatimonadaceae bacterium]